MTSTATQSKETRSFPASFKWGVATSAHQIEGGNEQSDWWEWEKLPGKVKHGDQSGAATDHWNRLEEDADLIKSLNASVYRFSIEWAKVEPHEGFYNEEAIRHYQDEVKILNARGIESWVTLIHFTLPQWLAKKGGLEWEGFPDAFARYARKVSEALGPLGVKTWMTLNEPMVVIAAGYLNGVFAPGEKRKIEDLEGPIAGSLRAHMLGYRAIKGAIPDARVGVAHHLRIFDPADVNPLSFWLAKSLDNAFNWAFVMALETGKFKATIPLQKGLDIRIPELKGTQDFLGINYYSRDMVSIDLFKQGFVKFGTPWNSKKSDLGWEIYPEGFYRVLKAANKKVPNKTILITENGIADSRDHLREKFTKDHLAALHRAITDGVPVEGYCHWSLLDNFEWAEGFEPRFGLFEIDYKTFKRTPRKSADAYGTIARKNALP